MHKKILEEIKRAMIEKNLEKKDVLKQVIGKAQAEAKEKKEDVDAISDLIILNAIQKETKQLKETLLSLSGKEDSKLYQDTLIKIAILKDYLPKQITGDELEKNIIKILEPLDPGIQGGRLKGVVMTALKGLADPKEISDILMQMEKN